jgi:DNA polymerase I-like protein with 3'-5' exonuclease and polymerase domains
MELLSEIFSKEEVRDAIATVLIMKIIDTEIMDKDFKVLKTFLNDAEVYYRRNGKTLPTLLGWQTVIEDPNVKLKEKITRSRSYPVQASGAELMRQWLIEINNIIERKQIKKTRKIQIINTIHDQVLIECDLVLKDFAIELLNESIKEAAKIVGIDEDIISINIEKKYPKY